MEEYQAVAQCLSRPGSPAISPRSVAAIPFESPVMVVQVP